MVILTEALSFQPFPSNSVAREWPIRWFSAENEHLPACTQGALVKETMKCLGYSSILKWVQMVRETENTLSLNQGSRACCSEDPISARKLLKMSMISLDFTTSIL